MPLRFRVVEKDQLEITETSEKGYEACTCCEIQQRTIEERAKCINFLPAIGQELTGPWHQALFIPYSV